MEIRKKIDVHSPDTKWIMDQKLKNGQTLVKGAAIKLIHIYDMASEQYVYAYMTLSQLLAQIYKVKGTMQKLVGDFESLLASNQIKLSDFSFPVKKTYELQIGIPLVAELMGLLEIFDKLNCLLSVANKLNLFRKGHQHYYRAITKNRGRIHGVFVSILEVNFQKLKTVTIEQYLNKDSAYLQAAETMGIIRPAALFGALNIGVFPWLPTRARNTVFHRLKHMEAN